MVWLCVKPTTFCSRFHRAGLPSPKRYLAGPACSRWRCCSACPGSQSEMWPTAWSTRQAQRLRRHVRTCRRDGGRVSTVLHPQSRARGLHGPPRGALSNLLPFLQSARVLVTSQESRRHSAPAFCSRSKCCLRRFDALVPFDAPTLSPGLACTASYFQGGCTQGPRYTAVYHQPHVDVVVRQAD